MRAWLDGLANCEKSFKFSAQGLEIPRPLRFESLMTIETMVIFVLTLPRKEGSLWKYLAMPLSVLYVFKLSIIVFYIKTINKEINML